MIKLLFYFVSLKISGLFLIISRAITCFYILLLGYSCTNQDREESDSHILLMFMVLFGSFVFDSSANLFGIYLALELQTFIHFRTCRFT